jgi:hypothetical protein
VKGYSLSHLQLIASASNKYSYTTPSNIVKINLKPSDSDMAAPSRMCPVNLNLRCQAFKDGKLKFATHQQQKQSLTRILTERDIPKRKSLKLKFATRCQQKDSLYRILTERTIPQRRSGRLARISKERNNPKLKFPNLQQQKESLTRIFTERTIPEPKTMIDKLKFNTATGMEGLARIFTDRLIKPEPE